MHVTGGDNEISSVSEDGSVAWLKKKVHSHTKHSIVSTAASVVAYATTNALGRTTVTLLSA